MTTLLFQQRLFVFLIFLVASTGAYAAEPSSMSEIPVGTKLILTRDIAIPSGAPFLVLGKKWLQKDGADAIAPTVCLVPMKEGVKSPYSKLPQGLTLTVSEVQIGHNGANLSNHLMNLPQPVLMVSGELHGYSAQDGQPVIRPIKFQIECVPGQAGTVRLSGPYGPFDWYYSEFTEVLKEGGIEVDLP